MVYLNVKGFFQVGDSSGVMFNEFILFNPIVEVFQIK